MICILVEIVFIHYLFGIRSVCQTIKEVDNNAAYCWVLGYDFNETIPNFATFGKNYIHCFREPTLFEAIFAYILEQAAKVRMITEDVLYMDSTHNKANVYKYHFTREMPRLEAKAY